MIRVFVSKATSHLLEVTEQAITSLHWPVCLREAGKNEAQWVVGGDHRTLLASVHWLLHERGRGALLSVMLKAPVLVSWGLGGLYLLLSVSFLKSSWEIGIALSDLNYRTWENLGTYLTELLPRLVFLMMLGLIHIILANGYKGLLARAVSAWEEAARMQGLEPIVAMRPQSDLIFRGLGTVIVSLPPCALLLGFGFSLSPIFLILLALLVTALIPFALTDVLVSNLYLHWKAIVLGMLLRNLRPSIYLAFNVVFWLIPQLLVLGLYGASAREGYLEDFYGTWQAVFEGLRNLASLSPPESLAALAPKEQTIAIWTAIATRFTYLGNGWPASFLLYGLSAITLAWALFIVFLVWSGIYQIAMVRKDWRKDVLFLSQFVPVGHSPGTLPDTGHSNPCNEVRSIFFKFGVVSNWLVSLALVVGMALFAANAMAYVFLGSTFLYVFTIPLAWINASTSFLLGRPLSDAVAKALVLFMVAPFILNSMLWLAVLAVRTARTLLRLVLYRTTDPNRDPVLTPICLLLKVRQPVVLLVPGISSIQSYSLLAGFVSVLELSKEVFERLQPREKEAVLAHEAWHLKNDVGMVTWLKTLSSILPGAGTLLTLAIDFVEREFAADAFAARYQGGYRFLWSALDYLDVYSRLSVVKASVGWQGRLLRIVRNSTVFEVLNFLYGDLVYGSAHPSLAARKLRLALAADGRASPQTSTKTEGG